MGLRRAQQYGTCSYFVARMTEDSAFIQRRVDCHQARGGDAVSNGISQTGVWGSRERAHLNVELV